MSLRHRRLILLLTSAFAAVALLCPIGHSGPAAVPGPLVSAAPPLFTGSIAYAGDENPAIGELRREADLALGQLLGR